MELKMHLEVFIFFATCFPKLNTLYLLAYSAARGETKVFQADTFVSCKW